MGTLPMETPLLSLLVLALVTRRVPAGTPSGADWASHLLLPLAITVTRIDAVVIPATWAVGLVLMRRRPLALAVTGGALAGLLVQVGLNWFTAGEWMSVAVVVKTWRKEVLAHGVSWPSTYLGRNLLLGVLLGASLMAVWRHARATGDRHWLFAWIAMASFTVPHFIMNMRPWYFVPGYFGCTALLVATRDAGTPSAARTARIGIVAGWLGLAAFAAGEVRAGVRYMEEVRAIRDFVRALQAIVPPGEPIYQVDGSGYIGFFSERPVVNGDGFVNTHAYAERLKEGRLAGYLDEEGIDYIVTNHPDTADPVNFQGLIVTSEAVEEIASKRGPAVNRFTSFRLFRRK
jgi:hypothetical protein